MVDRTQKSTPAVTWLYGLPLANVSLQAAAEEVLSATQGLRPFTIAFVNANSVNIAASSPNFYETLKGADRLYADGIGMRISALLSHQAFVDNVNGTDLFPLLCAGAAARGIPLAFIGARPGVADLCAVRARERYDGIDIRLVNHGYLSAEEWRQAQIDVANSGARLVFIALGSPMQEGLVREWASTGVNAVFLAVGGLFDFASGMTARAPRVLRQCGLEWAFRLAVEPKRLFRRYIVGNPVFVMRAIRMRLHGADYLKYSPPCVLS